MLLMLLAFCSCTSEDDGNITLRVVQIYVSSLPAPIVDGVQSRVDIDDNGNASWADGDEILLAIQSATTSQNVTLVYTDGEWTPDVYIKPVDCADITAYYAPVLMWGAGGKMQVKSGRYAGADEYLVYTKVGVDISSDGININFCDGSVERSYSRLRVYMGKDFVGGKLALDGMTPAGFKTTQRIVSSIQNNGCAYFYGSFSSNATLTYTFEENKTIKTAPVGGSVNGKGYFNNLSNVIAFRYVDLGLTSGNKWANCNLDAPSSTLAGGYYCWGGTSAAVDFVCTETGFISQPSDGDAGGSSISNIISYVDSSLGANKYKFPLASDAAYSKLGTHWHVPTYGDWKELATSCTWRWTSIDGVNGYKVTGTNGNSIFLPAVGYYFSSSLSGSGENTLYQCSTLYSSNLGMVYSYFISKEQKYFNTNSTSYGLPIRAVYSE